MPQRKLKVVETCTTMCRRGNPLRYGYCQCRCRGKQHGSQRVDSSHLEHLAHQKLMDPNIGKAEARRWTNLLESLAHLEPPIRSVR